MSDSLWLHGLQHTRLPCPSPTPGPSSNSCPSSRWCHSTISFSVIPFSSHLQSFPASGSFQMSQFSALGGQSFGVLASASVLPMNIQDWFPLGWAGWIQGSLKHLLQYHRSKASILWCSAFFAVQLSHPYMTTGKAQVENLYLHVMFSCSVVSDSLQPHGLQHTRLPCPSPSPRVRSRSCPLSQWCYLTISPSVAHFSFCLQSFPALGAFPMSLLFSLGSQSIGASASVLPMNI